MSRFHFITLSVLFLLFSVEGFSYSEVNSVECMICRGMRFSFQVRDIAHTKSSLVIQESRKLIHQTSRNFAH